MNLVSTSYWIATYFWASEWSVLLLTFVNYYISLVVQKLKKMIFWVMWVQERFYFGDNVLPCFESGVPLLKDRLHQLPDSDNVRFLWVFNCLPSWSWVLFNSLMSPAFVCELSQGTSHKHCVHICTQKHTL